MFAYFQSMCSVHLSEVEEAYVQATRDEEQGLPNPFRASSYHSHITILDFLKQTHYMITLEPMPIRASVWDNDGFTL